MKLLILVLGAFTIVVSDESEKLGVRYYVSTDEQKWFQAFINCRAAGMELASIYSESDQLALEAFLTENEFTGGYWLSGTNLGNGKDFFWAASGKPVTYTKWLPGQPDNLKGLDKRGENCIQWGLNGTVSSESVGWNDLFCGKKLKYVCEEKDCL